MKKSLVLFNFSFICLLLGCSTTSRYPAGADGLEIQHASFFENLERQTEVAGLSKNYSQADFIAQQLDLMSPQTVPRGKSFNEALSQSFQTSKGGKVDYLNTFAVAQTLISSNRYLTDLAKDKPVLEPKTQAFEKAIFASNLVYAEGLRLVISKLDDVDSSEGFEVFQIVAKGGRIARGLEDVITTQNSMHQMQGITKVLRAGQARTAEAALKKYKLAQSKNNEKWTAIIDKSFSKNARNEDWQKLLAFFGNFENEAVAHKILENLGQLRIKNAPLSYAEINGILEDSLESGTDPVVYTAQLMTTQIGRSASSK